ncbi:hypothetical protein C8F04DRAFT_87950 [Mycena alexandri]|uniref:Secreted protein n=1 Tax=Mycena alexandri TaxID=1745969 RepID=A0AAD6WWV2_9AGAR|nr:hypothetical protein C8F04DRAFT_87950 [Mycena alexandri]
MCLLLSFFLLLFFFCIGSPPSSPSHSFAAPHYPSPSPPSCAAPHPHPARAVAVDWGRLTRSRLRCLNCPRCGYVSARGCCVGRVPACGDGGSRLPSPRTIRGLVAGGLATRPLGPRSCIPELCPIALPALPPVRARILTHSPAQKRETPPSHSGQTPFQPRRFNANANTSLDQA